MDLDLQLGEKDICVTLLHDTCETYQIVPLRGKKRNRLEILNTQTAVDYIRPIFMSLEDRYTNEYVICIFLTSSNISLGYKVMSKGNNYRSFVCARNILQYMLLIPICNNVILLHNHPSGSLEFSDSDKKIFSHLESCLSLFDYKALDNIILAIDGDDNLVYSSNNI